MPPKKSGSRRSIATLPVFSAEETSRWTVAFENVETRLCPTLEAFGCAIVTGVASPEECDMLEQLFCQDIGDVVDNSVIESATEELKRAAAAVAVNVRAWPLGSMGLLGMKDRCQLRGMPHGRFAWGCRLLGNVRRCYEVIHSTKELVSSCDNPFFAPATQEEAFENNMWPHTDHNSSDNRFFDSEGQAVGEWEVYQGILYVWSSEESHASTTVVLPGSHLETYGAMMMDPKVSERGRKGEHFTQLTALSNRTTIAHVQELWNQGAGRVPVPAGALFLWSSKTLHQGWSGGPRLAQPLCWEPIGRRDAAALERKLRLAALGLPSTHWASLGIPHYLVKPKRCECTEGHVWQGSVHLPARQSIKLASLSPSSNVMQMWDKLERCEWEQALPNDLREFIERSLTPDVRAAL